MEALLSSKFQNFDLKKHEDMHSLKLDQSKYTTEQFQEILSLLQFPKFVSLKIYLTENWQILNLVEALNGNQTLKTLTLTNSLLDTSEKLESLNKIWDCYCGLEELNLIGCHMGADFIYLLPRENQVNDGIHLKKLSLRSNNLRQFAIQSFGENSNFLPFRNLVELDLGNNKLNHTTNLQLIEKCPNLIHLYLDYNQLRDDGFDSNRMFFAKHPTLEYLNLNKCHLHSEGIQLLHQLVTYNTRFRSVDYEFLNQYTPEEYQQLEEVINNNKIRYMMILIMGSQRLYNTGELNCRIPPEVWEQEIIKFL